MGVTGSVSIAEMNTAIETTLATATGLTYTQDFDKLTEGIIDTPTLQVYWESILDDPGSNTSQRTFGGVVRQASLVYHADLYPKQRADLAEDMGALLPLVSAIQTVLEAQRVKPYFGLVVNGENAIEAIEGWSANRVVFDYPNNIKFLGARFVIRIRVF